MGFSSFIPHFVPSSSSTSLVGKETFIIIIHRSHILSLKRSILTRDRNFGFLIIHSAKSEIKVSPLGIQLEPTTRRIRRSFSLFLRENQQQYGTLQESWLWKNWNSAPLAQTLGSAWWIPGTVNSKDTVSHFKSGGHQQKEGRMREREREHGRYHL